MSNNFEIISNHDDWKVVRTSCECMSDDHILNIEIEQDRDFGVTLIFNYNLSSKDLIDISTRSTNWFKRIYGKVKFILKIIFDRPIDLEQAFIFRNKEHVDELCDYIKSAAEEMNKR